MAHLPAGPYRAGQLVQSVLQIEIASIVRRKGHVRPGDLPQRDALLRNVAIEQVLYNRADRPALVCHVDDAVGEDGVGIGADDSVDQQLVPGLEFRAFGDAALAEKEAVAGLAVGEFDDVPGDGDGLGQKIVHYNLKRRGRLIAHLLGDVKIPQEAVFHAVDGCFQHGHTPLSV